MVSKSAFDLARSHIFTPNDENLASFPNHGDDTYKLIYSSILDTYVYEVVEITPFSLSSLDPKRISNIVIILETTASDADTNQLNKYSSESVTQTLKQLLIYYDDAITIVNVGEVELLSEVIAFCKHNTRIKVLDYFEGNIADIGEDLSSITKA